MTINIKYFSINLTPLFVQNLCGDQDMQISDKGLTGLQLRYSGRTGRKVYYAYMRIANTNKQRKIKIGNTIYYSLQDARTKTIELRRLAGEGKDPVIEKRETAQKVIEAERRNKKLKILVPEFLEKHSKLNNRQSTYDSYESMFRLHIVPLLGEKIVWNLELSDIQDAYDKIRVKHNKPYLCDHVARLMSSFLNWCEKYNYRPLNSCPTRHITKMRVPKRKHIVLDLDGYQKLFGAFEDALLEQKFSTQSILALKTLALTGCRCSEITDLEFDELDLCNGYLRLNKRKTDTLDVPLGNPAIEVLKQAVELSGRRRWVFPSPHTYNRHISTLRRPFNWALRQAGLPSMRIHDLRHSFASMGIGLGEDIRIMKDILGHTKITTTEIYAHTTNRAARISANNVACAIAKAADNQTPIIIDSGFITRQAFNGWMLANPR